MLRPSPVLAAVLAALAACSSEVAVEDGLRVASAIGVDDAEGPTVAAAAAAVRTGGAAAVVALDANGLAVARRLRAGEAPALRVVAVAETPAPQADEALVVPSDPAPVAVDLALLACHGVALPRQVALGLRVVDAANVAAGGQLRPGPGDVGLAVLARQHAAQLTTTPTTDVVFRVGMVASAGGESGPGRAIARARAAAARYPQLVVEARVGDGTLARAEASLRELLAANVRAVVVALADPAPLAAVAARAAELRIPIVAIEPLLRASPAACVVGSDPAAVGRALADAARIAVPAGGALLLLRPSGSAVAEDAFRAALAPRPQ